MAGSADHPLFPDDSLEKGCRGIEEALRSIEEAGSWKFRKILGLDFFKIPGSGFQRNPWILMEPAALKGIKVAPRGRQLI